MIAVVIPTGAERVTRHAPTVEMFLKRYEEILAKYPRMIFMEIVDEGKRTEQIIYCNDMYFVTELDSFTDLFCYDPQLLDLRLREIFS